MSILERFRQRALEQQQAKFRKRNAEIVGRQVEAVQREADIPTACERMIAETRYIFDSPSAPRAALLRRAAETSLAQHHSVRRLEFLGRVLAVLRARSMDLAVLNPLLEEAEHLQMGDADAVQRLTAVARVALLAEHRVEPIGQDERGRPVYLRCQAEFKNKRGTFEVRDDGVTFIGEVLVDIPWAHVVHATVTTHRPGAGSPLEYPAVAFQEGKRRTATKFAFLPRGSSHIYDLAGPLTVFLWQRAKTGQSSGGRSEMRPF